MRTVPIVTGRQTASRRAVSSARRSVLFVLFVLTTVTALLDLVLLVNALPH